MHHTKMKKATFAKSFLAACCCCLISLLFHLKSRVDWLHSISQDIIIFVFKRKHKKKTTVFYSSSCMHFFLCMMMKKFIFFSLKNDEILENGKRGKRYEKQLQTNKNQVSQKWRSGEEMKNLWKSSRQQKAVASIRLEIIVKWPAQLWQHS